jgi:hypothetical protein
VWLTKDDQLVVVHGGCNGDINFGQNTDDEKFKEWYIFDLTLEENRSIEKSFELPTLD